MTDNNVKLNEKELGDVLGGAGSNANGRCELKVQQISDPQTATCKWCSPKSGSNKVCANCTHYMG